ncbi:hypothetical protein BRX36_13180 [Sphingomonas sp. S-NIH.Pt1_0416]|nr:hypothetical protein BRX36_13180 [Sphingomonas sp. S-NIH.Pt1_0416]
MAQLAEDGAALRAYLARFDAGHPVEAFVGDPAIAGRYTYTAPPAPRNDREGCRACWRSR